MFKRIAWTLGLLAVLSLCRGAAAADAAPADQAPDPAVAQQGGALLDRMMPSSFNALWLDNTDGVAALHACEAYVSPSALQAWPGLVDFPYATQPGAILAYLPYDTPYGQDVFQAVRQGDGKWKVTKAQGAIATASPSPAGMQALIESCLAHFGAISPNLVYPTVYTLAIWPPRVTRAAQ